MSRPTATAFQAAELCLGQSLAKYGAYGKREQPLGDAHTLAPLPGAGPPRPGSSASDRVLQNTVLTAKGNNPLGMLTHWPLAGGRASQARGLCLGQGSA